MKSNTVSTTTIPRRLLSSDFLLPVLLSIHSRLSLFPYVLSPRCSRKRFLQLLVSHWCLSQAWESDEAIEEDLPESPGPEGHDKEKEHRDSKRARGQCVCACVFVSTQICRHGDHCPLSLSSVSTAMKTSTSMDSTENKKTRHKLKKFLTRRPTLQAVRDKGYIKGGTPGYCCC